MCMYLWLFDVFKDLDHEQVAAALAAMLQSLPEENIMKAQCHAFVIAVDSFPVLMLFMFVL